MSGSFATTVENKVSNFHSSRSHGAVHDILATIRKIGLDKILLSYDALAQGGNRFDHRPNLEAGFKVVYRRMVATDYFTGGLGLEGTDPNPLYQAMDELVAHQEAIQRKLAAHHLHEGRLVLYDLSSTYLEGDCCPLAAYGHNRDGKKGKKQFNYGLLTTATGCPVAIKVFPGNRSK